MKYYLMVLIVAVSMLISLSAMAENKVQVIFDGTAVSFETDPIIENGTTLVPFRTIFERMGFEVSWDDEERTAIGSKDDLVIKLPMDKEVAYVNDESKNLEVSAKIVNNTAVVPIRFVSEVSGYIVTWEDKAHTINIQSPEHIQPDRSNSLGIEAYNVRNFGVKGDGKSNDTKMIQIALNVVSKAKGTLYFPSGTYLIDAAQKLTVNSDITVIGEGMSTKIQANHEAEFGNSLFMLKGDNIRISRLRLDGNYSVLNIVIVQSGSTNIQIDNSSLLNASQSDNPSRDDYREIVTGISVYGNTDQISIEHNDIQNIKAVHLNQGSLVARGIYLTENKAGWHEKAAKHVSIANNYIHDIGPADDGDGIYYEDPSLERNAAEDTYSKIQNNRFENCAKRAIKINAQGIEVTGNEIINNYLNNNYYFGNNKGELAPDMYAGISIYADNNKVTDNVLQGKGSFYAAIEVTAERTVNNVLIKNNTVKMGANSNLGGKTAIRIGRVNDFTVSSNVIENGEIGIWMWQSASNGVISGNKISMPSGGGINLDSYLPNSEKENVKVSDNSIQAKQYDVYHQ
ncbi:stalk domain-containing protein [Paenibacillus aestuarii]|uniref:Stalk domain-containing protein n=1 Tax=Paenibacillus aestuarii TaxID=516965 RepID=A0ABW0K181_9BACL|nr:stalk domain-containing protein [Paenibacillus aestuarii]